MIRSGCWAITAVLTLTLGVWAQTIQPYAGGAPHAGQSYAAGALSLEIDFTDRPVVLTGDRAGDIFLANGFSSIGEEPSTVFELTPAGQLLRFAGNGVLGYGGDGGPATAAEFNIITGLATAPDGSLYIADSANAVIRKVSATTGVVSTVAGTAGVSGYSGDGGLATAATLNQPDELGVDPAGNLYLADRGNCALREVNAASGTIRTVASLCAGTTNPSHANFALSPEGDVYVTDPAANAIWRIDATTGVTTHFAGAPAGDFTACEPSATRSCPAQDTNFYFMGDLGVDAAGEVFILAGGLAGPGALPMVEKITQGTVSTLMVGHGLCYPNCVPVPALGQSAPAFDLAVAFGTLWVTPAGTLWAYEAADRQLLSIDTQADVATTEAGNGQVADSGDGGPPLEAQVHADAGLAIGPHGELYAIDQPDYIVRQITAATLRRVAGHANGFGGRYTGPVPATQFNLPAPNGIAVDSAGNLFISDSTGYIWRVDAHTGMLTDYTGLAGPHSIAIDAQDNLYVCSFDDQTLEILANGTQRNFAFCAGAIDTQGNIYAIAGNTVQEWVKATGLTHLIAGDGTAGFSGDGGPATAAELRNPTQVGVDGAGNVFIAGSNGYIREVYAANGIIRTIAGDGSNSQPGFTGPAADAAFPGTHVMAVDAAGDVFVSTDPNEIREIKTTPALALSATALDFGSQILRTSPATQSLQLTNTGGVPLMLANFSVAGADAGDFGLGPACALPLAPGASCTLTVTFTPAASGSRSAQLNFTDNAGNGGATVTLTGTGVVITANLQPSTLDFGSQRTGTASAPQTLTLTNTGSADLAITSLGFSGGADFAQTNTCGATLAAGTKCAIAVVFQPGSSGARAATLVINDNAPDSPQSVALTGMGTSPAASLSAAALTFAPALIGASSAAQPVTLSNPGTAVLNLAAVKTSGDFQASSGCGTTVAPGASCAIQISFTPSAAGARSGALTLTDDAGTQTVSLAGTGQDFSLTANGPTQNSITAGQTAQYTLQVLPDVTLTAPVLLTCAVAPSPNPLVCQVPAAVQPSGTDPLPVPVTVTVTAAAAAGGLPESHGPGGIIGLLLTAMALLLLTASKRRVMASITLGGLVLLFAACGGAAAGGAAAAGPPAKSQTPATAYTLTVTASSGPLTRSLQLTLTLR